MDDRRACRKAVELGLSCIGTLAVLEASANKGWIDFRESAQALRGHGFFVTTDLIEKIAAGLEES